MSKLARQKWNVQELLAASVRNGSRHGRWTGALVASLLTAYLLKRNYVQIRRIYLGLIASCGKQRSKHVANGKPGSRTGSKNPTVNLEFIHQLMDLLKIMIPSVWSIESGLLVFHTGTLVARTFLSVHVAKLEGKITKYIVKKDASNFLKIIVQWIAVAIPATFVNSMIRFLESQIGLAFRSRLVKHSYELYFQNDTYYRIGNLDRRIDNADHCLTEDVSAFSHSVAHLYSHLTKPLLDLAIITFSLAKLNRQFGTRNRLPTIVNGLLVTVTAHILRKTSPKFGKLVAQEAEHKGYLRHLHSRVIANAEEIAFYGGHGVELVYLKNAYRTLAKHLVGIYQQRLWYVMLEQFLMKYVWSASGIIMVAIPLLWGYDDEKLAQAALKDGDRQDGVMSAVPSLKSLSMVKVAVLICTSGGLNEDIFSLSLGIEERACMIEKKSRTAIEKLNVPKSLRDPLANQTLLVAIGMSYWGQSLNGLFDLDVRYCTSMLDSSMFLSNGKIDKMKVAEKLVKDEKLNISERFEIACFYWLEDSIVDFWGRMTVEQRQTFTDAGRSRKEPHRNLAVKVARELEKGGGVVFSDRVVVREVIECAMETGSEVAVWHLWSQLDPAEMEEMAEAMIWQLPLCADRYYTEEVADILCFLLPILKDKVKADIIGYHLLLFDILVFSNRINAIWNIMSSSMQYMRGFAFVTALVKISKAFCRPSATCHGICCDDYRELVKKIWTQSPVHLKKYAITEDTPLWEELLFPPDKARDIFSFFLKDATHEEKLDLIFSNGDEEGLICVGFYEDVSVSNFLLQFLNLSQDEKRQVLKREILLHDPLTCTFSFGLAAQYCLQFEDEETKAEYKRQLVGDRIEEICVQYILNGDCWTELNNLLCWYFSTAEEIGHFKTTLLDTSGRYICLRLYYRRRSMLACYAWFGLDPKEICELESRVLS